MFWLTEQTPWGGEGRAKSQSSREDFKDPRSLARMLCLTKQILIEQCCPQRLLGCKPVLMWLRAGKGISDKVWVVKGTQTK